MKSEDRLIIYGVPFSQPVRAVLWVLLYKGKAFELELINPGSSGRRGSRNPDYLALNPAGMIPLLREPDSDFVLGEAHAIMTYLCRQHGWDDLYPSEARAQARVDAYLHFHHRWIRPASTLVAARVRKDLNFSEAALAHAEQSLVKGLKTLEKGGLAQAPFLAGDHVTLADFAAYAEIGQLQPGFTNLFDFTPFPKVGAWLDEMKRVALHDDVHVVLSALGDISQEAPTMDALKAANKQALEALHQVS